MPVPTRAGRVLTVPYLLGVFAVGGAEAQTVRGDVRDAATDRRIANAILRLIDSTGDSRLAFTADSTGGFSIVAPEVGSYRLQADHLGYESFSSDVFELVDPTTVVTIDVAMRATPIPIRGVEVSADQANRRLRDFLGSSPGLLRIRPIRANTIWDHLNRGNSVSEMIRSQSIPNLQVLATRDGPCYQFRGRGCMPVYLDGARLRRAPNSMLPLEMLATVVVLLPNEIVAYPEGAVHLLTIGYMR